MPTKVSQADSHNIRYPLYRPFRAKMQIFGNSQNQLFAPSLGINDDEDLPKEYLSKIYEEIALSEIKVKPTATAVGKRSLTQDMKTRNLIWSQG